MKITFRNVLVILPLAAVNTAVYLMLNRWPPSTPTEMPLTALDRAVPFWVVTVWPYLLLLSADVILPLFIHSRSIFQQTLLGYGVAIVANITIWTLLPTFCQRPPLPTDPSVSSSAYRLLMAVDWPRCAFPSGHITIPAVACWGLARQYPRLRQFIWTGFGLLSLSVLTTKQHTVLDLAGGLGTATLGIAVSGWLDGASRWLRGERRLRGETSQPGAPE